MEYERSVKEWIKILKSEPHHSLQRRKAAIVLGRRGDHSAIKPLIRVLKRDLSPSVRGAAARALGELGDSQTVKPLIDALLLERSVEVREWAAWALGRIGDHIAVNPLITALRTTSVVKPRTSRARRETGTRYVLVETRTRYRRTRELIDRREPITQHELRPLQDSEEDNLAGVRRSASLALGRLGDQSAIEPLIHAMRNDLSMEVRRSAALALREFLSELDGQTISEIEALVSDPVPVDGEATEVTAETQPKLVPVARTRKVKLRCPSCQRIIRERVNLCPKCGKVLSRCLVCHKVIGPDDDYIQCPYCMGLAHRDHLEQWLLIKAVCPYCQQHLQPHSLS